jgi:aminoglycoside phosphotransferase family enzyme/predicted kinase
LEQIDDQDEVAGFLSAPATYGSGGTVKRIDTHAAIVFLTADRAYKLKRAIHLPYLDFSSVDKRRAALEAELRLNRRTAPELYLEVRAVTRRADGRLGFDEGEAIDWVLVMRRFPDGGLLEEVAERGELDRATILRLADNIARFHAEAAIIAGDDGETRVRRVIEGNRRAMAALPTGMLDGDECEQLTKVTLATLEKVAPLLDRRACEGHVRHCHGDLHLANICLWRGQPVLFDCLEFDDSLATTDTLYDIAFLLMDLCERGFTAEANLLFNRYCDMTGEAEGLAALPLFLSMRAAIRAHVSASAAGRQTDQKVQREKLEQAHTYLAAALSFLESQPPRLVAIGGLSGTGKSTLAGLLAPAIGRPPGARWLRTDVLRKRLAGATPEDKLPQSAYTPERNREIYRELARLAEATLAAGQSAIVDGVFASQAERRTIAALALDHAITFTGLWLEAPSEELFRRVDARAGDASDADSAVVRRQLAYDLGNLGPWHKVDASGSLGEVAKRAKRMIEGTRSG